MHSQHQTLMNQVESIYNNVENMLQEEASLLSVKGGEICVVCQGIENACVTDAEGREISTHTKKGGIAFSTEKGKSYRLDFKKSE